MALSEIGSLIASIHGLIASLGSAAAEAAEELVALIAAFPVKKSVTADYIGCLKDGQQLKSM